jgi:tetratricopeptide (TPR) repeat protein
MMQEAVSALEQQQFVMAAEIFRRVVQTAPFRHDAREFLAYTIDQLMAHETGQPPPSVKAAYRPNGNGGGMTVPTVANGEPAAAPARRVPIRLFLAVAALVLIGAGGYGVLAVARRIDFGRIFKSAAPGANTPTPGRPAVNRTVEEALAKADDASAAGQFEQAVTDLTALLTPSLPAESAKRIHAKIGDVFAAKSDGYLEKHNYERALEVANEGLKQHADSPRLNYLVGRCYERLAVNGPDKERQGHFRKSIAALEKASGLEANNYETLYQLARVYYKVNETGKAMEMWKNIIRLDPDSPKAKDAKDLLRSMGFKIAPNGTIMVPEEPASTPAPTPARTPTPSPRARSRG